MSRTRAVLVRVHRWAGLGIATFLVVAGLTGGLLAFLPELETALNPHHRVAEPPGAVFDPLALREAVQQRLPLARVEQLPLHCDAGQALHLWIELPDGAGDGEAVATALVLDPYSGAELSRRTTALWPLGRHNLMAFVYRLHYSLALGDLGLWLFGAAALVWTLDAFVGLALTLPPFTRPRPGTAEAPRRRSWLARWQAAWRLKRQASAFRRVFDLHRATGLWTWLVMLAFAWSAVYFNLGDAVYRPVMRAVFGDVPGVPPSGPQADVADRAAMPWPAALAHGRGLMAAQAAARGIAIRREQMLSLDGDAAEFRYAVLSDRDVSERWGATAIRFDAVDGRLLALELPTGEHAGTTLTSWIVALHTAAFWGRAMQIFVCAMGLAVSLLSLSGVYVWWRKRRARHTRR